MKKLGLVVVLLINFVFIGIIGTLQVSGIHTPDHAEAQAIQCAASGGSWNGALGVCAPATTVPAGFGTCSDFDKTILGIPTWYKYLEGEEVSGKCKPKIEASADALPIGLAVLEMGLTLGGLVAVVMVFVGGFKYVLSQGEPDKAAGGRKTVVNAMIGLVIIIVSTRVVSFVAERLG